MNKLKSYCSVVLIFIFMCSCGQDHSKKEKVLGTVGDQEVSNPPPQNEKLAQVRKKMTEDYNENESNLKVKKTVPCDSYFKVIHSIDQATIDLGDAVDFISLDLSKCKNNVELSQSYNERLFRLADKRPDLFIQGIEKVSIVNNHDLIKEWKAPLHDGIEKSRIVDGMKKAYQSEMRRLKNSARSTSLETERLNQAMNLLEIK